MSIKKSHIKSAVISYVVGFTLSVALTLLSFMLVRQQLDSGQVQLTNEMVTIGIFSFAAVQLIVQLVFFLHLGQESRPRWNLVIFISMLVILGIVVFGSLWIMNNLNYHMMSPSETERYMIDHPGGF